MKHSPSGVSRKSIRRAGLAWVGWLVFASAGIPIGFTYAIRALYSADIPAMVGRTLWWVVFGACLVIGAGCVALAFSGRAWVRALAIVAYLFIMAPALLYLGIIESGLPRLVCREQPCAVQFVRQEMAFLLEPPHSRLMMPTEPRNMRR